MVANPTLLATLIASCLYDRGETCTTKLLSIILISSSRKHHSFRLVPKTHSYNQSTITLDESFLSAIFLCQPLKILGPDPQYSQNDYFCKKCNKGNMMFLESMEAVTNLYQPIVNDG
jgi:hypothetical protein